MAEIETDTKTTLPKNLSAEVNVDLVEATEKDSDELKKYFSEAILPGPVDLSIHRQGSFFDQYRLRSDNFHTFTLRGPNGEIEGMASMMFSPMFINGEEQMVGYATDLRISPTRRAILGWRNTTAI